MNCPLIIISISITDLLIAVAAYRDQFTSRPSTKPLTIRLVRLPVCAELLTQQSIGGSVSVASAAAAAEIDKHTQTNHRLQTSGR